MIPDYGQPAKPGSPLWEQRRQGLLNEQRRHIDEIGWTLMGVTNPPTHAWVYTIGHHAHGLPELVATSSDPNGVGLILNEVSAGMRTGKYGPFGHGDELALDGGPVRIVQVPPERTVDGDLFNGWFAQNGIMSADDAERMLRPKLWMLQVVWAGHDAKAPDPYATELAYPTVDEPWSDQPIYGEVWW